MRVLAAFLVVHSVIGRIQAQEPLSPASEVFRSGKEYGFMWWTNRYAAQVFRIQTSRFGVEYDATKFGLTRLAPTDFDVTEEAVMAGNSFPEGGHIFFRCVLFKDGEVSEFRSATPQIDAVQLVEAGRFFQRRWNEATLGQVHLNQNETGLELGAWPDRLSVVLRCLPTTSLTNSALQMSLVLGTDYHLITNSAGGGFVRDDGGGFAFLKSTGTEEVTFNGATRSVVARTSATNWPSGRKVSAGLIIRHFRGGLPGLDEAIRSETSPLVVRATPVQPTGSSFSASFDRDNGWHKVSLGQGSGDNGLYRIKIATTNNSPTDQLLRINFEGIPFSIPGLSAVLRDQELNPIGIPVQLSKNWHGDIPERFQGSWFRGLTMLMVPAGRALSVELAVAGQNWGGIPAASHAQLSVIGYGANQQWDESALGNFGEALTYDVDNVLTPEDCADSRPLLVRDASNNTRNWGGNAGGASFMRYFDESGAPRRHTNMRTRYARYCPNRTEVIYAGESDDRKISLSFSAGLFRSDDYTRGVHRVRMDVRHRVSFSRFVFYQQATDTYHPNQGRKLAYGDAAHREALREWTAIVSTNLTRVGEPVAFAGPMPWASVVGGPKDNPFSAADHGFVIRSWRARIGGVDGVPPYLAERAIPANYWFGNPCSVFEVVPPPGITSFEPGDFVEAEIVRAYFPASASTYYGPNTDFRHALTNYAGSYRLMQREAIGQQLKVESEHGKVVATYPILISTEDNYAEFHVTGGIGVLPVTFTGLTDYREPLLQQFTGGEWIAVNQAVNGKDFWQCDFNAAAQRWEITFSVRVDDGEFQTIEGLMEHPRTHRYRFRVGAAAQKLHAALERGGLLLTSTVDAPMLRLYTTVSVVNPDNWIALTNRFEPAASGSMTFLSDIASDAQRYYKLR